MLDLFGGHPVRSWRGVSCWSVSSWIPWRTDRQTDGWTFVMLELLSWLKTTPKWPLTLWNFGIGDVFSMSTDVWSNHWIGLEKLPQNDPWHFEIRPLDQKLWRCPFSCQLMCTVTSPLDWPWKTTQKWLSTCKSPSTGSKDEVKSVVGG